MFTIKKIATAKQDIKKSNFIVYLVPINEFESYHRILKEKHQKAVHIVWAYRHYNKYFQIVENQSDDGEPKGTSGPPALNALRGADLIECGVFIVRYFGGIKLGTGGLVRAYSSSTNLAIKEAEILPYEIKDTIIFKLPYNLISRFDYFFENEGIKLEKEFNEFGAIITSSIKLDEFKKIYKFSKEFAVDDFEFLQLPLFAKEVVENI